MSTLDREPRTNGAQSSVYQERRVDPGVNSVNPQRVEPQTKTPPAPPMGAGQRGGVPNWAGRMPVKR